MSQALVDAGASSSPATPTTRAQAASTLDAALEPAAVVAVACGTIGTGV